MLLRLGGCRLRLMRPEAIQLHQQLCHLLLSQQQLSHLSFSQVHQQQGQLSHPSLTLPLRPAPNLSGASSTRY